MESWNHSLKVEAIHGERFATREHAKTHVFDYVEVYYNRRRLGPRVGPDPLERLVLSAAICDSQRRGVAVIR